MYLTSWMLSLKGSSILLKQRGASLCLRKLIEHKEKKNNILDARNTMNNRFQVQWFDVNFQLKQTCTLGIETSHVEYVYVHFFPCQRLHRGTAPLGEPRPPDSFHPKKFGNHRRFTFFQNCSLSVPTYLPLAVDILELVQAGLQVELFSLWYFTCHLL
jgi:hypothetical protein